MTPTRFEAALCETLKWEGGWSNDPHDPGGPTMCGVIQRVYDAWRDSRGLPRQSVRSIENAEIKAIYQQNYWRLVRGDDLPPGIALAVFDYGVNSGPSRAVKALQRELDVTPDGHIGAMTLAAVKRADPVDLIERLMAERREFLRRLPHFWRFGKGWLRRCDGVEKAALLELGFEPVADDDPVDPAVDLLDADAVTSGWGRATNPPLTTMWESTTATTATTVGGAGATTTAVEFSRIAAVAASSPEPVTVVALLLAAAQSPVVWAGLLTVAGSVYIWLERRRKIVEEAV